MPGRGSPPCRNGRHRVFFRLTGEDNLELSRLIHRRDLESALKWMA